MSTANQVKIVEVGPRDGLQNEKQIVSTAVKVELIARLVQAGLRAIEAASFVSPKWVPQMADHAQVMAAIARPPEVVYSVLAPNLKGFEGAAQAGATEVAVFSSASETFSARNINCSIAESLDRFVPVMQGAQRLSIKVRGYVSCAIACPYEGPIDPRKVAEITERLLEMGCHEVSLADTIGVGTPATVLTMLETVARRAPVSALAGHYHDTYGTALMNIYASYQFGLRVFDSSVSGLGGCPYAKGATGNVATEDVVYLLNDLGAHTGVDLDRLIETSAWISAQLQREPGSKVTRATLAKRGPATACL